MAKNDEPVRGKMFIPIEATVHESVDAMADHVHRMFPNGPRPPIVEELTMRCLYCHRGLPAGRECQWVSCIEQRNAAARRMGGNSDG